MVLLNESAARFWRHIRLSAHLHKCCIVLCSHDFVHGCCMALSAKMAWFGSSAVTLQYSHAHCLKLITANMPLGSVSFRYRFYTLMVISTALFDKPAFKNLVCNGLVLAADGKKMSKRLKNYPVSPFDVHTRATPFCYTL